MATFLATPTSANLLAAVTNETGTGALVFGTGPTLTTPISATLTSPASTNLTLAGGTAGSDSVVVSNTLAASSAIIGAFKVGNGTAATNVAIGGGKVNIGDTTAGSSGAGALVVQGGISAGQSAQASYFGGAVTAAGLLSTSAGFQFRGADATNYELLRYSSGTNNPGLFVKVTESTKMVELFASGSNTGSQVFRLGNVVDISSTGLAISSGSALKLGNAYVAGAVVGTGSITIQDSTGTTYRIPVLV